jgi:hypothetical protein
MRHNTAYIWRGRSDAQSEEKRSENHRAQADGYAKLASRRHIRHIVQRESILRSQGSSSGPLRDAAAAQRRGAFDRRHSDQLRSFAPHGLSGSVGVRTSRPEWSASKTSWTQRRTQAFRGGHRVCARLARSRSELDDRRLYRGHSGKVFYQGAPTQSRKGAEEQKKTAQPSLDWSIPEGTVEAYEALRQQVIQPDARVGHVEGHGILLRSGLAAWARLRPAKLLLRPLGLHPECARQSAVHHSSGDELVRLVAGLILSIRLEDFLHA